jgi:Holliday junction DNA helicase RuvA
MIAKLRGLLDSFAADHAVVDVNGVGYLVFASTRTLSALGPVGGEVVLHTVMQVSEDDIRLIGFASGDERDWFRLLTTVQGVGARVALAILSTLTADELHRAVASGDHAMIARSPGVGPKLAQRIVEARGTRPFRSADDLRRVKGIGPKTLEKVRPFVTLGP